MMILSAFYLLGLATCALSETCPSNGQVFPCTCKTSSLGRMTVKCKGRTLKRTRLSKALSSIAGKDHVRLELSELSLGNLGSNFFYGTHIEELIINDCEIDGLADDEPTFHGLEDSLKVLEIRNSLSYKESSVKLNLGYLHELDTLELSENGNILELRNDWLMNAPSSLRNIRVLGDGLKITGDRVFANLNNLFDLVIENNQFESIQRSMLPNPAERLAHLSIVEPVNLPLSIPEDFFSNMPALESVYVNNAGISRLHKKTWKPIWGRLGFLSLLGNPLVCDTRMSWMFLISHSRILMGNCEYPANKKGMYLSKFIDSNGQAGP